jgi:ornithine carbamoyltransferase
VSGAGGGGRHFLDLDAVEAADLRRILDRAAAFKRGDPAKPLAGRTLAMIFEKPSTRTRVSFEVAARQLGGDAIVLTARDMQLGRGETVADTARVLSRYVDAIMIRADGHAKLLELAEHATVPVVNGLTDHSHPCQIMADLLTVEERQGDIRERTLAWVGDGNNVLTSLVHAAVAWASRSTSRARPSSPRRRAAGVGRRAQGRVRLTDDPRRRCAGRTRCSPTSGSRWGTPTRSAAAACSSPTGSTAPHGTRRAEGHIPALPPGAPRRGGHRRGHRRAPLGRLRRGREPPARPKGDPGVVSRPER